jgi:anhydro-N-acetylmuramic acid kinase
MADLAHGGQGAPISPLADALMFQSQTEKRAIINLGGFINITTLSTELESPNSIQGFDLCICNQWLDQLANKFFQKPYDEEGKMAQLGQYIPALSQKFYDYFKSQWQHQRSLGSHDDQNDLLNDKSLLAEHSAHDILKSSCYALAKIIIEACKGHDRLILAGGGCHNKALISCLEELSPVPVQLSDMFGLPFQQREAALMAILGNLCLDKQPITLPQVTGCQNRKSFLSGSWVYP